LEIAKPKPVPPNFRVVERSSCTKEWNFLLILLLYPHTGILYWKFYSGNGIIIGISLMVNCIDPSSVNFKAFAIKLTIICFSRTASAKINWDTSLSMAKSKSMFFSLAWCLKRAMTWLASPTRSISSIF
jgi:hypothetical protein